MDLSGLESFGDLPDKDIDLAAAALALAALQHPGLSLERYRHHLGRLVRETGERHGELLKEGVEDDLETRLAALKHVLVDVHGYQGDAETYDDLQNADLIRVIDRRKGMPITLSILAIHVARAQGWEAHGLNIPGHFVVRLDKDGGRIIADPFNGCKILQAADLRHVVKQALGPKAELSANYYEPASNRAILIRLQNNIKTRQIEGEDYEGALRTVESMQAIDPKEYRLLLDAGVLYTRTRRLEAAVAALEKYIAIAPHDRDRHDAAVLLQSIRQLMS